MEVRVVIRTFHLLDESIDSRAVTAPVTLERETVLFTSDIRIIPLELSGFQRDESEV